MHHEPQVGFVEPHTEGAGRHEGFYLVVFECLFGGDAFFSVHTAGVGQNPVPSVSQRAGGVLRRRHGEGVDNAGAG